MAGWLIHSVESGKTSNGHYHDLVQGQMAGRLIYSVESGKTSHVHYHDLVQGQMAGWLNSLSGIRKLVKTRVVHDWEHWENKTTETQLLQRPHHQRGSPWPSCQAALIKCTFRANVQLDNLDNHLHYIKSPASCRFFLPCSHNSAHRDPIHYPALSYNSVW